jgi:hypothetical protein
MWNIQKICVFIYFVITIYVTMWNSGWMVKTMDCGQGGKKSKPMLDMFWFWHVMGLPNYPQLAQINSLPNFFGIVNLVQECFGFILSLI